MSGVKKIRFDFEKKNKEYYTLEEEIEFPGINIYQANLLFKQIYDDDVYTPNNTNNDICTELLPPNEDLLFLSGSHPEIYNLKTKETHDFFKENLSLSYTFIIRETNENNAYFLFIKDLYLILLLKENTSENQDKQRYIIDNIKEKNLSDDQFDIYFKLLNNLDDKYTFVDLWGLNMNGGIINVHLDSTKSLILINSYDRILRLYKYDYDTITLVKEYFDSVNRKKWINAYFYTFKIKNKFQDIIVSALSDVNSLEFIFIDINTGNFMKRMEPFKYQCSDFIVHYMNHFSIILISNKKLFHIYGYLVNHWGAFAPQFKYIEENIEYIEEENFFDNFNKILKQSQVQKVYDKEFVSNIFKMKDEVQSQNLFFKYTPEEDTAAIQSEKDLKDIFQQFNEIIEAHK